MTSYMLRVAIGVDQMCNAILGGSPDETFSARCWRKRGRQPWGLLCAVVNGIFFWQHNHCYEAWVSEHNRAQLPRSYREEV